jgi:hypothetical protein
LISSLDQEIKMKSLYSTNMIREPGTARIRDRRSHAETYLATAPLFLSPSAVVTVQNHDYQVAVQFDAETSTTGQTHGQLGAGCAPQAFC